ncbi:MAG TPA: hypothetical protein VFC84_14910 [Desulfosporosinus sp.]|nr:hypothetical protein [Desulfosporosinus sp.]
MTDAEGNSRPPSPRAYDRRRREFARGRSAGRTFTVGWKCRSGRWRSESVADAGDRAFWTVELARQAHRRRR